MNKKQANLSKKNVGGGKSAFIPLINDYSSRREWESVCWRRISASDNLLNFIVTFQERHDLVMRVAAFEGLVAGKGQRQLSRELSISLQTINGVKKAMKEGGYRSYLERSKQERKKKRYSSGPVSEKSRHQGRPVRTKYGIVHLPY